MAVRPLVFWPDPRLRQKCAPVPDGQDMRAEAQDLLDTMYREKGRGLAGPQVGIMARIFVMDVTWKDGDPSPLVCINPSIEILSPQIITRAEGCLSIPGIVTAIGRPERIRLNWRDVDGMGHSRDMDGWWATCAQHEYDHLNGLVTFDRLDTENRTSAQAAWRGSQERHDDG